MHTKFKCTKFKCTHCTLKLELHGTCTWCTCVPRKKTSAQRNLVRGTLDIHPYRYQLGKPSRSAAKHYQANWGGDFREILWTDWKNVELELSRGDWKYAWCNRIFLSKKVAGVEGNRIGEPLAAQDVPNVEMSKFSRRALICIDFSYAQDWGCKGCQNQSELSKYDQKCRRMYLGPYETPSWWRNNQFHWSKLGRFSAFRSDLKIWDI